MKNTYTYNNVSWIDFVSPTSKEARDLVDTHGIHPRIAQEVLSPTIKPKLSVYNGNIYLVLHFPAIRHTHSNEKNQEVDFILTKDSLITVHYDTVDSISAFAKEFEISAVVDKDEKKIHAGFIFYHLILKLYNALQDELDFIESSLAKIEDNIFLGKERSMVIELSSMSRVLLDMEQTIEGHERALKDLLAEGDTFFGKSFTQELQDVLHEYHTVYHRIRDQREFLGELRTANDSLLSAKQNEIMKTLTIMAFVTFPLSLVAGIFGMNTIYLPFIGKQGDFWIVIGIMVALTALMFAYFKHNKWL